MALYLNGIKIAGRGISGKSPYQVAVEGGYSGTEADFNTQLAAIGESVAGFNELRDLVESSKTEVEEAVAEAQEDINNLKAESEELKITINQIVVDAETRIDEKVEDALASIPDSENIATKLYVQEQISNLVTDIWYYGDTAPSNTKLFWIDSNTTTGGLKYYDGSAWTHVPVAWS